MITITTVLKTSSYYSIEWVEKMKRSLENNLSIPFNFIPLSDSNHEFPYKQIEEEQPGYWNKIELFRPGLYTTPTLFIDLDNVIIGDLSDLIEHLKGNSFLMYKSRTTPFHPNPTPSSTVMYWEGDHSYLWDIWKSKSQKEWLLEYKKSNGTGRKGDQGFIREHVKNLKLIQDVYPVSYSFFKFVSNNQPNLDNVKMLIFAGGNKPNKCNWPILNQHWI